MGRGAFWRFGPRALLLLGCSLVLVDLVEDIDQVVGVIDIDEAVQYYIVDHHWIIRIYVDDRPSAVNVLPYIIP
jgi:hypothetical protein